MNEAPPTLEYRDDRAAARRGRLLRQIGVVILAKLLLVAVNVSLAFIAAPAAVRFVGIAAQVGLTLVFFLLLLKLVGLGKPH